MVISMHFIFILLFIILLVTNIEFKIMNVVDSTDVSIKFGFLKIHIDYDMFIKSIKNVRIRTKMSLSKIKLWHKYYEVIKKILLRSNLYVNKIEIVKNSNNIDISSIYLNITYYAIFTYFKSILFNNSKDSLICFFVRQSHENDFDFEVDFNFNIWLLIINSLLNINNILKIKKDLI